MFYITILHCHLLVNIIPKTRYVTWEVLLLLELGLQQAVFPHNEFVK